MTNVPLNFNKIYNNILFDYNKIWYQHNKFIPIYSGIVTKFVTITKICNALNNIYDNPKINYHILKYNKSPN